MKLLLPALALALLLSAVTSGRPELSTLDAGHSGRKLQAEPPNGRTFKHPSTGAVYTIFGWNNEDYPANSFEAWVNCTRLNQEQPDISRPQDLFAVRYISANAITWVKTAEDAACTATEGASIHSCKDALCTGDYSFYQCDRRYAFVCVQRKPLVQCGRTTCLPGQSCCGVCCNAGWTCCDHSMCCPPNVRCCKPKGLMRVSYCASKCM